MKIIGQCCKTCHWWDINSVKDKVGRVRRDKRAACKLPSSKLTLPESMRYFENMVYVPDKRLMSAEEGTQCAFWTPFKK